mmetsp:Transcript_83241/g.137640  ORF Transcript_83241/g.137640 Transcript_83241/m.137640 type:complete len:246 (-) Transcript_83241:11-748(-)
MVASHACSSWLGTITLWPSACTGDTEHTTSTHSSGRTCTRSTTGPGIHSLATHIRTTGLKTSSITLVDISVRRFCFHLTMAHSGFRTSSEYSKAWRSIQASAATSTWHIKRSAGFLSHRCPTTTIGTTKGTRAPTTHSHPSVASGTVFLEHARLGVPTSRRARHVIVLKRNLRTSNTKSSLWMTLLWSSCRGCCSSWESLGRSRKQFQAPSESGQCSRACFPGCTCGAFVRCPQFAFSTLHLASD